MSALDKRAASSGRCRVVVCRNRLHHISPLLGLVSGVGVCACMIVSSSPPIRVASIQHHRSPSVPIVLIDIVSDSVSLSDSVCVIE